MVGPGCATALERTKPRRIRGWSRESDLNRRPADYESAALPLSYLGNTHTSAIAGCRERQRSHHGRLVVRPSVMAPVRPSRSSLCLLLGPAVGGCGSQRARVRLHPLVAGHPDDRGVVVRGSGIGSVPSSDWPRSNRASWCSIPPRCSRRTSPRTGFSVLRHRAPSQCASAKCYRRCSGAGWAC